MKSATKLLLTLGISISGAASATTVSMVAVAGLTNSPMQNTQLTLACASDRDHVLLGTPTTDSTGQFSFDAGKCTALVGNPTSQSFVGVLCGAGPKGNNRKGTPIKNNGRLLCYHMGPAPIKPGPVTPKPNAG